MGAPLDRSRFLVEVKEAFPELITEINAQGGGLHFEVDVLRLFAERMIGAGDRKTVARIFGLAERAYREGDAKLKDAIDVSFVEPLNFSDSKKKSRAWAWQMLPETLKRLYVAFHGESNL